MATIGSALVYIRAKTDELKKDLGLAEKDVEGSAGAMSKSISNISWKAVGAAAIAFGAIVAKVSTKAIAAANEQEKAEAKLTAVIRSTGGAAGFTAKEMFGMAAELQRVTTYGDETTISAMAVLATFKEIGGEAFPRTVKAAADMASVMGTDLQSAIVMIGKAMNDPIANLSAMSRAGVQFTDEQKSMVKQLWISGDALGAQKIILTELESQFGGTSEAMRTTFGGAMKGATNALGDLWEEIGFAFTKNQQLIGGINDLEDALVALTPAIGSFAKNTVFLFQDLYWAGSQADSALIKLYDFMIGDALRATEKLGTATGKLAGEWLKNKLGVKEVHEAMDDTYSDFGTYERSWATMTDAMEDSYLDYGGYVKDVSDKLENSIADNWSTQVTSHQTIVASKNGDSKRHFLAQYASGHGS
jgi:hypothetical protein